MDYAGTLALHSHLCTWPVMVVMRDNDSDNYGQPPLRMTLAYMATNFDRGAGVSVVWGKSNPRLTGGGVERDAMRE